jgi:hypothetical protein
MNDSNEYPSNTGPSPYDGPQQPYAQSFSGSPQPPQQQQSTLQKLKGAWSWYLQRGKVGKIGIGCGGLFVLMFACTICSAAMAGITGANHDTTAQSTTASTPVPKPTHQVVSLAATPTPKPTPTPKLIPTPTEDPAQTEEAYKQSTTFTTVAAIDKNGSDEAGKNVNFNATIVNFVKDDSGKTAGANVTDGNGTTIQIAFAPTTDITQLNAGDMIEVWGVSQGVSSGQNAFGATIQEAVVFEMFITDKTNGYQK